MSFESNSNLSTTGLVIWPRGLDEFFLRVPVDSSISINLGSSHRDHQLAVTIQHLAVDGEASYYRCRGSLSAAIPELDSGMGNIIIGADYSVLEGRDLTSRNIAGRGNIGVREFLDMGANIGSGVLKVLTNIRERATTSQCTPNRDDFLTGLFESLEWAGGGPI